MKEIQLVPNGVAVVDDADYELVSRYHWHNDRGYAKAYYHGGEPRKLRVLYMHRLIANPENGRVVDHADGNRSNNTRANLRVCKQSENSANQRKPKLGASRFKGVNWHSQRKRWVASISPNGRSVHLGLYDTEAEAAHVYDLAARYYFGPFAATNAEMI